MEKETKTVSYALGATLAALDLPFSAIAGVIGRPGVKARVSHI
jgi:hypothetical protein